MCESRGPRPQMNGAPDPNQRRVTIQPILRSSAQFAESLQKENPMSRRLMFLSLFLAALAAPATAQLSPSADWAVHAANQYQMTANVTYRMASGQDLKLDVYARRGVTTPQPTLIYMHGGFWVAGAKETALPA